MIHDTFLKGERERESERQSLKSRGRGGRGDSKLHIGGIIHIQVVQTVADRNTYL